MVVYQCFIPVTPQAGEIAQASYPSENFDFSVEDKAELMKAWDLEPVPVVVRSREQMISQRERSVPLRWFDV